MNVYEGEQKHRIVEWLFERWRHLDNHNVVVHLFVRCVLVYTARIMLFCVCNFYTLAYMYSTALLSLDNYDVT